ncbi:MAG: radical SAM family heme chaperone HemW [bacterium]|nr:radical SAM family heme chaperone HemW [bacterium]
MKQNLGLYVHIPFCERKCLYCDFLSGPSNEQTKKEYVEAVKLEIKKLSYYKEKYKVVSIFFGGGTPSSIEAADLVSILDELCTSFAIENRGEIEITVESNPGTLTKEKLDAYYKAGINRISMGLQSTHNEELQLLGRIHTYEEFLENYHAAKDAGFTNINVDLMSALPNQTEEGYEETLSRIIALQPTHISAYSLIIEEGTPFYKKYGEDQPLESTLPTEEEDRKMYHLTKTLLQENGYHRYEISNYALDGKECIHNSLYWTGTAYLGFGVGASSYIEGTRYHNIQETSAYIEAVKIKNEEELRCDIEELSKNEKMEEFMFLGLRLTKGVSKAEFEKRFGTSMEEVYKEVLDKHQKEGLLEVGEDIVRLTEAGLDVSNYVMADFIM